MIQTPIVPRFRIYLAGPISGLTYYGSEEWRHDFKENVSSLIACYSPLRTKEFLAHEGIIEDSYSTSPLSTDRGIMTRDHHDCKHADLVVMNFLDVDRVSIGTVMEAAWAFAYGKPLIAILPKGSVHDHPMIREAITFPADNVAHAVALTHAVLLP